MISLDDELAEEYLAECREHLTAIETGLLSIEKAGAQIDGELINQIFRAVHSVKGGAGFFDLVKIRELAHQTENALALIRNGKLAPTPERVRVLLRAADKLRELSANPDRSNQADITEIMAALAGLCAVPDPRPGRQGASGPDAAGNGVEPCQDGGRLRSLLVEDDFTSRLVLQTFLSRYGVCHIAVNGKEAVKAVQSALERGERYDLICMDIMMPEMNGREAVRRVRALEEEHGLLSTSGVKIIMTTAVDDIKEVIRCFRELCDAYLIKPVDLAKLLSHMKSYRLVP